MAAWKKVKRSVGSRGFGRAPRKTFGVIRVRTGTQNAYLIVPKGEGIEGKKADIYSDGNGKLAFVFGKRGTYTLAGKGSPRVIIPKDYRENIPFGTTDVTVTKDGDMYVLDLNSIGK